MNIPHKEDDYVLTSQEHPSQPFMNPMLQMSQMHDMYSQPQMNMNPMQLKNNPLRHDPIVKHEHSGRILGPLPDQGMASQYNSPTTSVFGYGMPYDHFSTEFPIHERVHYDDNSNIIIKKERHHSATSIGTEKPPPPKPRSKSAHNVIEQRYRNKINDKFQVLQNAVPTLRVLAVRKKKFNKEFDGSSDEDVEYNEFSSTSAGEEVDLEGLEPARKLNKGTILAKSIEYIKFLELKNDRLRSEHDALLTKARMMGIDS